MKTWANKPAAGDAGIASRSTIAHHQSVYRTRLLTAFTIALRLWRAIAVRALIALHDLLPQTSNIGLTAKTQTMVIGGQHSLTLSVTQARRLRVLFARLIQSLVL